MKICDALKTKPIRIPLKKIFPTENMKNIHCKLYGYQLDTIPIFQISEEKPLGSEYRILKFLNIPSGFFRIVGEHDCRYMYYMRRPDKPNIMYLTPENNYKNIRFELEDLCNDELKIENIQKLDALNLFVLKWNKKRTCDEASCRAILEDFDTYVVEEEHKNYIKNLTSNKCQELTALYEGRILCVAATISLLIKKLKGNGNTRYIDFNYSDFCRQTNTKSSLKEYLRYMLIRMPLIDPQYLLLTPIPEIAKYIQIAIDILPYIPVGDKIIK